VSANNARVGEGSKRRAQVLVYYHEAGNSIGAGGGHEVLDFAGWWFWRRKRTNGYDYQVESPREH